jgi:hypothetical protein
MPKLNGKHYAYTKKGIAAYKKAKAAKKRKKKDEFDYFKESGLIPTSYEKYFGALGDSE